MPELHNFQILEIGETAGRAGIGIGLQIPVYVSCDQRVIDPDSVHARAAIGGVVAVTDIDKIVAAVQEDDVVRGADRADTEIVVLVAGRDLKSFVRLIPTELPSPSEKVQNWKVTGPAAAL